MKTLVHEHFELTIDEICRMPDDEFLELCSRYLHIANHRDYIQNINRQARDYGRILGIKADPDWMLDWYSYDTEGNPT